MDGASNEGRERALAWVGTIVAALYFAYRGITMFRASASFEAMFEGLGAELPTATRLAIQYRLPIFVLLFGLPAVAVVGKEWLIRDKRISMMVTMIMVIVVIFGVDILATVYYLPLMDLLDKLAR